MTRKGKAEVLIDIKGDSKDLDDAVKKSNRSLKTIGDSATNAAANMAKIGVAVAGIAAAFSAFAVKEALPFEGLNRAFRTLVSNQGEDADVFMAKMKEMSSNTVTEMDIMKRANMGLMLGLDTATLVQFMEAATSIAQATGESVGFMFESLTTGTARQSKLWLDNLGIIISLEKTNQAYADSLGITVGELTDTQKKTAFVNAAMDESKKKIQELGGYVIDTKTKWSQLETVFKDTTVSIGQKLMPELDKVLDWTLANKDWFISTFAEIFTIDVTNIGDAVVKSLDKIKKWVDDNKSGVVSLFEEIENAATGVSNTIDLLLKNLGKVETFLSENINVVPYGESTRGTPQANLFQPGPSLSYDVARAASTVTGALPGQTAQHITIKLDAFATQQILTGETYTATKNATIAGT